jgi:hypothetical protein
VHLAVLGAPVDPVCNVAQNPGDLDREMPVFEGGIFRVESNRKHWRPLSVLLLETAEQDFDGGAARDVPIDHDDVVLAFGGGVCRRCVGDELGNVHHRINAGLVSDLLGLFGERGGFGHF